MGSGERASSSHSQTLSSLSSNQPALDILHKINKKNSYLTRRILITL